MKILIKKLHVFKEPKGKTKAVADITIGGMITIYGCSVVEGNNGGYFVGMPQKKDPNQDGKYWSIVFIENKELMEQIRDVVVGEYKKLTAFDRLNDGCSDSPEDISWSE